MNEKLQTPSIDKLFQGILKLENMEECYRFFEDLCTIHELQSLAQRLDVADMLIDGKTYLSIGATTGASTATISRVNRCLNYGEGGYKFILDRIKENS